MSSAGKYLVTGVAAILLLGLNFATLPRVFEASVAAEEPALDTARPVLLFSRANFSSFYTSADILHPEAFGAPGEFYEAVLFDILAAGEGEPFPLNRLTWVRQIDRALRMLPPDPRLEADERERSAEPAAEEFLRTFAGAWRTARPGFVAFRVPESSNFRRRSGITRIIGLAVKEPHSPDKPLLNQGNDSLLAPGFEAVFEALSREKVRSVAIPFLSVSERLGEYAPEAKRWQIILEAANQAAPDTGIRKIVFGAWGIDERNLRGARL
ncbi:MAG: hypothetical protein FJW37_01405 [Acidobacteria bacterium]|nr:hypothetical protein [Acidobacteriota bacterium]